MTKVLQNKIHKKFDRLTEQEKSEKECFKSDLDYIENPIETTNDRFRIRYTVFKPDKERNRVGYGNKVLNEMKPEEKSESKDQPHGKSHRWYHASHCTSAAHKLYEHTVHQIVESNRKIHISKTNKQTAAGNKERMISWEHEHDYSEKL